MVHIDLPVDWKALVSHVEPAVPGDHAVSDTLPFQRLVELLVDVAVRSES